MTITPNNNPLTKIPSRKGNDYRGYYKSFPRRNGFSGQPSGLWMTPFLESWRHEFTIRLEFNRSYVRLFRIPIVSIGHIPDKIPSVRENQWLISENKFSLIHSCNISIYKRKKKKRNEKKKKTHKITLAWSVFFFDLHLELTYGINKS